VVPCPARAHHGRRARPDARDLDDAAALRDLKRLGFSDRRIARWSGELTRRGTFARGTQRSACTPVYGRVDTCAAEFVAHTPYLYSTYEDRERGQGPERREKVIILGGGPNRIGQGIEFDYCCVHAAFALREPGSRPSWSTATRRLSRPTTTPADRLYFEPLTLEDVLASATRSAGEELWGDRAVRRADPAQAGERARRRGRPLLGTTADAIDRAEDRGRFDELLGKLDLARPRGASPRASAEARSRSRSEIGYPVVVRPSYVLGGRAMMICHDEVELDDLRPPRGRSRARGGYPDILVDEFLEDAIEVDVDAWATEATWRSAA
jgi:carbamoyl-phosphate synthase large subunit